MEFEVFNFMGAGGVALSMYNTDEVCISYESFGDSVYIPSLLSNHIVSSAECFYSLFVLLLKPR